MRKPNITPGPWAAICRDGGYTIGEHSKDHFLQFEVEGPEEPFGRGEFFQEDAVAIAAVHDLIDALLEVESSLAESGIPKDDSLRMQVRNALFKAGCTDD